MCSQGPTCSGPTSLFEFAFFRVHLRPVFLIGVRLRLSAAKLLSPTAARRFDPDFAGLLQANTNLARKSNQAA
jgi:hypothetical protein